MVQNLIRLGDEYRKKNLGLGLQRKGNRTKKERVGRESVLFDLVVVTGLA